MKTRLDQTQVGTAQSKEKHVFVQLRGDQTVAEVLETPGFWVPLQRLWQGMALSRGDFVTIQSPDGLVKADRAYVKKISEGHVWFGPPARMLNLDPEDAGLYSNGVHQVVNNGSGYSVKTVRDSRVDTRVYSTAEAAKAEVLRRQPVRV